MAEIWLIREQPERSMIMLGIFKDSKDIRLLVNFREGGSRDKNNDKTRGNGGGFSLRVRSTPPGES